MMGDVWTSGQGGGAVEEWEGNDKTAPHNPPER